MMMMMNMVFRTEYRYLVNKAPEPQNASTPCSSGETTKRSSTPPLPKELLLTNAISEFIIMDIHFSLLYFLKFVEGVDSDIILKVEV